jgi:hypothetical protein
MCRERGDGKRVPKAAVLLMLLLVEGLLIPMTPNAIRPPELDTFTQSSVFA